MDQHPHKLRYDDLVRMGIVRSRAGLRRMIERGTLRPPHKDGKTLQAAIWWFYDDVMEDLARERQQLNAAR